MRDYAIEAERDGAELAPPSAFQSIETPSGVQLVSIPLIDSLGKSVRAGLTLDADVAEFIDSEAQRRGMTRKAYITWIVRRIAATDGWMGSASAVAATIVGGVGHREVLGHG